MSQLYANTFLRYLKEASLEEDLGPEMERGAMENSLDDDVSADEFDTDLSMEPSDADAAVADAMSERNRQMTAELEKWIQNIEEFLAFLNGEEPNSVQSRLSGAEPDTIMDKMKQSQQTKISRVASDLAALHQNFLGFKAQASNPKYKYV